MAFHRGRMNRVVPLDTNRVQKTVVFQEKSRPFRLLVEHWVLSEVRKRGVPTPDPMEYAREDDGRERLIVSRIEGAPLSLLPLDHKLAAYRGIGQQMLRLRDVTAGYGWIVPHEWRGAFQGWKEFLAYYLDRYGNRLAQGNHISDEHLRAVMTALDQLPLASGPYILHRDLKPANLHRDADGQIWILDWENAILGDPVYDIACFGAKHGHGYCWQELIEGYGLPIDEEIYRLYEILALMGIVCFGLQHHMPQSVFTKHLVRNIQELK